MAYPPPPGLKNQPSSSSTPQPHPSLPARPPPPAHPLPTAKFSAGAPGTRGYPNNESKASGASSAFTAFKPRTVGGGNQNWRSHSPTVSAAPAPPTGFTAPQANYNGGGYQSNPYQQQPSYYQQQSSETYAQPTPPQILNPFPVPGQDPNGALGRGRGAGKDGVYDPEIEAQIAQWQSAYAGKDDSSGGKSFSRSGRGEGAASAGGANAIPLGGRPNSSTPINSIDMNSAVDSDTGVASIVAGADGKQKTVVRSGGGKSWQDPSLLEWNESEPRLFIGNLAGEVTDESLLKAFAKYPSVTKARVVRDKRTTKSKGYGFVSFASSEDFFNAAKEMQGKYIGSHPVSIRRSTTEIKAVVPTDKKKHGKNGRGGGGGGLTNGAGVQKKQKKDKGGVRMLG